MKQTTYFSVSVFLLLCITPCVSAMPAGDPDSNGPGRRSARAAAVVASAGFDADAASVVADALSSSSSSASFSSSSGGESDSDDDHAEGSRRRGAPGLVPADEDAAEWSGDEGDSGRDPSLRVGAMQRGAGLDGDRGAALAAAAQAAQVGRAGGPRSPVGQRLQVPAHGRGGRRLPIGRARRGGRVGGHQCNAAGGGSCPAGCTHRASGSLAAAGRGPSGSRHTLPGRVLAPAARNPLITFVVVSFCLGLFFEWIADQEAPVDDEHHFDA